MQIFNEACHSLGLFILSVVLRVRPASAWPERLVCCAARFSFAGWASCDVMDDTAPAVHNISALHSLLRALLSGYVLFLKNQNKGTEGHFGRCWACLLPWLWWCLPSRVFARAWLIKDAYALNVCDSLHINYTSTKLKKCRTPLAEFPWGSWDEAWYFSF